MLTPAANMATLSRTAPQWAGGFGDSFSQGTEAMCRTARGFFNASRFMVGALGSRKAGRFLDPVRQPDAFTARRLATPSGDYSSIKESAMHTQNAPVASQSITMSSLEIAKLTGKEHRNVVRDIRAISDQIEGGLLKFEHTQIHPQNKQPYTVYQLPRAECDLVISGYSVKYRWAIIQRWHELENQLAKPQPNSLTINLAPLADGQVNRWMITQHGSMVSSWKVSNDNNPLIEELARLGYVVFKPEDGDIIELIYEHLPATQMPLFIEMAARRLRALPPPAPTDMTLPEAVKQHLKARYTHGDIKALCKDLGIHDQTAKRIMGRLYGKGDQE